MRHSPGAARLQRQAGLGAIKRLDMALLVDPQHDDVRRGIEIEADHVVRLVSELRVVRKFELPHPIRLETVRPPDGLHRADADAGLFRHDGGGPVGRVGGRVGLRGGDDGTGLLRTERRNTRRPRLVARETGGDFAAEMLVPAPDAGLRPSRPAYDLVRADALGAEQDDLGPPDVLLGRIAVPHKHLQTATAGGRKADGNSGAHEPDSHRMSPAGIPLEIQMSDFIQ